MSADAQDADKRLELVLSEALRALTYQHNALDNLRSRATLLTAGAAIISSSFAGPALQGRGLNGFSIAAIACMAGVLITTFVVCAPIWRWRFLSSASLLIQAVDKGFNLDEMRRNLSTDLEGWLDKNEPKLRTLHWIFISGTVLLLAEMSAWIVAIAIK